MYFRCSRAASAKLSCGVRGVRETRGKDGKSGPQTPPRTTPRTRRAPHVKSINTTTVYSIQIPCLYTVYPLCLMCAVVKIVVLLFQLLQFHIGGGAAELISTAPVREGVRRPDECAQPRVALVDGPPEAESALAVGHTRCCCSHGRAVAAFDGVEQPPLGRRTVACAAGRHRHLVRSAAVPLMQAQEAPEVSRRICERRSIVCRVNIISFDGAGAVDRAFRTSLA